MAGNVEQTRHQVDRQIMVKATQAAGRYPAGVVGRKDVAHGEHGMATTQHPLVTDAAADVLSEGGTAIDALITACMVQATVSQELTNHAGTVTALIHDAATGRFSQLNSPGWVIPGLAPFRPVPIEAGTYAAVAPGAHAVVPGFMPAMRALFDRGATLPWARLVAPALEYADEGYQVTSFEHYVMATTLAYFQHTASGRAHFTPRGRLPQVGETVRRPELAATLRGVIEEGPEYCINGPWARRFVEVGNSLGWPVRIEHLAGAPSPWGEPLRFAHRDHEVVSLAAPQIQGASLGFSLGVLDALGITDLAHPSEDPQAAYFMAHVLRRARIDVGHLNDPAVFTDPTPVLLDPDYHRHVARLIATSIPRINLTEHVKLTSRTPAAMPPPLGVDSCEISIVDRYGTWVQAMTTLSGSGIPAEVIGGVPMTGSLTSTSLDSATNLSGWYTGGGRVRTVMGNTMVLREGKPWLALGTPGKVEATVPQVLSGILHHGLSPDEAEARPLMMPLTADYTLAMETQVGERVLPGLAARGITVKSLGELNWHMGSFQMSWAGPHGQLCGVAGSRRAGKATGV